MKPLYASLVMVTAFAIQTLTATAQEKEISRSPLQLSLFPPLQLQSSETPIVGLRLGIFAKNVEMTGLGIGIVNWTSQDITALQWGVVNYTGGTAIGVHWGIANFVNQDFIGWQASAYNWNRNRQGTSAGSAYYKRLFLTR